MDERNNRIEAKLDKVVDNIGSINTTLAAQHESLKDHIRRTEILEEKIIPLEKHSAMAIGVIKFMGLSGALAAMIKVFLMLVGK